MMDIFNRLLEIHKLLHGGYTVLDYNKELELINKSKANFMSRLKDPNRATIPLSGDSVGTHLMSYVTFDDGAYIYPRIQQVGDSLVNFSDMPDGGFERAWKNHDGYFTPNVDFAKWFTENYKLHYPGFDKYAKGGSVAKESEEVSTTDITIAGKTYTVEVADNEELWKKGLMGRTSLDKDKGMLFDFNEEGEHGMWMVGTLIPLDQVFLDDDMTVLKVVTRAPEDEESIGCPGTWYVLEVNANSGIKKGDTLTFNDEEDGEYVMKILAPNGEILMQLKGGERIFSRKNTVSLIRKAKRAKKLKTDSAYASVGKLAFKYLDIQDNRDPEYVNAPD